MSPTYRLNEELKNQHYLYGQDAIEEPHSEHAFD